MKTLLKILAFVALGVGVLVVGSILFGLVASLFHILIPLAIVGAIGWVVWKVMAGGKGASQPAKQAEPPKIAAAAEPQSQAPRGLSHEEAAKQFDELKKGRPTT